MPNIATNLPKNYTFATDNIIYYRKIVKVKYVLFVTKINLFFFLVARPLSLPPLLLVKKKLILRLPLITSLLWTICPCAFEISACELDFTETHVEMGPRKIALIFFSASYIIFIYTCIFIFRAYFIYITHAYLYKCQLLPVI